MSLEIIIPIAAVIILLLLFTWLIKVFKSTIKTVLIILAILLLLQVAFGVDSQEIIQEMMQIVTRLQQLILGG
ncbi:MAG TPA: hypothetical protein V6C71_20730 [Coleofasciculaceae cyanobacterium]|jgi:hypothetical protein